MDFIFLRPTAEAGYLVANSDSNKRPAMCDAYMHLPLRLKLDVARVEMPQRRANQPEGVTMAHSGAMFMLLLVELIQ